VVLLGLAVLWGIVLLPPALRKRAEARQSRSVENFRKRLEVLAPPVVPRASRPPSAVRPIGSAPPRAALVAEPRPVVPPARRRRRDRSRPPVPVRRFSRVDVLRRRRQVFAGLCATAVLTLALALAVPGLRPVLGGAHVLVDVALTAYVTGLRRLRQLALERKAKVRYLPVAIPVEIDLTDSSNAANASDPSDPSDPSDVSDAGAVAEASAARSAAL